MHVQRGRSESHSIPHPSEHQPRLRRYMLILPAPLIPRLPATTCIWWLSMTSAVVSKKSCYVDFQHVKLLSTVGQTLYIHRKSKLLATYRKSKLSAIFLKSSPLPALATFHILTSAFIQRPRNYKAIATHVPIPCL